MLVDDEESIRSGTRAFLADLGYRVDTFENGRQALEEFTRAPNQYDLVLTDMNMPQMTGKDLSSHILTLQKKMPIILCTGYSDIISETTALEIGIQKYLEKPIMNEALAGVIREIIDRNKHPDRIQTRRPQCPYYLPGLF